MAEVKRYISGETLDLVMALINATLGCHVFGLMNHTERLFQLREFPEVDIPADP